MKDSTRNAIAIPTMLTGVVAIGVIAVTASGGGRRDSATTPAASNGQAPLLKHVKLTAADTQVPTLCATTSKVVWFANIVFQHDPANAKSHFFGPAALGADPLANYKDLVSRRCQDPSLAVAHAKFYGLSGYADMTTEQMRVRSNQLAQDHVAWLQLVNDLGKAEVGQTITTKTLSGAYQTEYMLARLDGAPDIEATSPDRPSFVVLVVGKRMFKMDCGFQPVAQNFPQVTTLTPTSIVLPTPTPSPTTSPPTCVPSTTVERCGKHASFQPDVVKQTPVVLPPSGGYIDRGSGQPVNHPYKPPPVKPNPGQQPGQGSAQPGGINTVKPPVTQSPPAPPPPNSTVTSNPTGGPPGAN